MESKLVIGIAGDSGVGKSTITSLIQNISNYPCTILNGDNYHKWERGNTNWKSFTHLNIHANRLHEAYTDLKALKDGKEISISKYDHQLGTFSKLTKINPSRIIIYEGLHSFFPEAIQSLYGLKIFIKADEPLRRHWKIIRDIKHRNYTKEGVLQQIEKRSNDSLNFIYTQEKFADIIIHHQLKHNINSFMQLLGDENFEANFETKLFFVNKKLSKLIDDTSTIEKKLELIILELINE